MRAITTHFLVLIVFALLGFFIMYQEGNIERGPGSFIYIDNWSEIYWFCYRYYVLGTTLVLMFFGFFITKIKKRRLRSWHVLSIDAAPFVIPICVYFLEGVLDKFGWGFM